MGRTVNTINNYCMHIYMHLLYNSFHVKLASDITAELSVYFSTKRQKTDDCKGHTGSSVVVILAFIIGITKYLLIS